MRTRTNAKLKVIKTFGAFTAAAAAAFAAARMYVVMPLCTCVLRIAIGHQMANLHLNFTFFTVPYIPTSFTFLFYLPIRPFAPAPKRDGVKRGKVI